MLMLTFMLMMLDWRVDDVDVHVGELFYNPDKMLLKLCLAFNHRQLCERRQVMVVEGAELLCGNGVIHHFSVHTFDTEFDGFTNASGVGGGFINKGQVPLARFRLSVDYMMFTKVIIILSILVNYK